jgi:N-acetylmuramoyl-L-alanine amidase
MLQAALAAAKTTTASAPQHSRRAASHSHDSRSTSPDAARERPSSAENRSRDSAAAKPSSDALASAQITPELHASLLRDYRIDVAVMSHKGDAWSRLAKRITGDGSRWKELVAFNGGNENLPHDHPVHAPLALLRPELQKQIVGALFPKDRITSTGWRHTVIGASGIEGESLWNIAEWFTGDGSNYSGIRKANPSQGLSTRHGDVIVVPRALLSAAFAGDRDSEPKTPAVVRATKDDAKKSASSMTTNAASKPSASEKKSTESHDRNATAAVGHTAETAIPPAANDASDDPSDDAAVLANAAAPPAALTPSAASLTLRPVEEKKPSLSSMVDAKNLESASGLPSATFSLSGRTSIMPAIGSTAGTVTHVPVEAATAQLQLTYERDGDHPFAVYHLQRGEALYSSVAIRFTGRVYAKDVGDVLERMVAFNGITNVARIPVGFPVRIPMELLLPEYRPSDDPARVARETARRESAKLARRVEAKGLSGVQIILDAGHGGRDVGTTHDGVFESSYVYDVTCRLKHLLEKRTAAKIWATTKSSSAGYDVKEKDVLDAHTDHVVLTSPQYLLDDPVVGVNLRWYLANSIFHRAIKLGTAKEKVIFVSLHADSLHPSLRGTMVYIPGERYVRGSFQKTGNVYLTRAEVREMPVVTHSVDDALASEGLSRDLAESVIDAIGSAGLKVHPFNPIRDNVVRDGKEWVPAVIRYNLVPTRVLIEICNLGNDRDRSLMTTRQYRQQIAQAIYEGIVNFFADDDEQPATVLASGKIAK